MTVQRAVRWMSPLGIGQRRTFGTLHEAEEFAAALRRRFRAGQGADVERALSTGLLIPADVPGLADRVYLDLGEPEPPVLTIAEWVARQERQAAERDARLREAEEG